jgi:hypothetical protein
MNSNIVRNEINNIRIKLIIMAVPKKRTSKSKKMLVKQIGKEKVIKQLKNLYL